MALSRIAIMSAKKTAKNLLKKKAKKKMSFKEELTRSGQGYKKAIRKGNRGWAEINTNKDIWRYYARVAKKLRKQGKTKAAKLAWEKARKYNTENTLKRLHKK